MKLTWLTDIHINFLDEDERERFYQKIINTQCDSVLITGDIAEADCVVDLLNFTSKATGDILMKIAMDNASIEFLVLCGHTHSEAHYQAFLCK